MRCCPKCKTFYDDLLLRFCLKDGVPLLEIDQSNQLWTTGKSFINEKNRLIRRETRQQQLKKILQILITICLVIMIICVITLWGWLYQNNPEDETTQNPTPTATVTPEIPKEVVAELRTPTPTPTPTQKTLPTLTPTPSISPTITKISPTPCNKTEVENFLKQTRFSGFLSDANNTRESAVIFFMEKNKILGQIGKANVAVFNDFSQEKMKVNATSCEKATIVNVVKWTLTSLPAVKIEFREREISLQYDCTKPNGKWQCVAN